MSHVVLCDWNGIKTHNHLLLFLYYVIRLYLSIISVFYIYAFLYFLYIYFHT